MAGVEIRPSVRPQNPVELDRIQSNCGLFAVIDHGENATGQLDIKVATLLAGAALQHRAEGAAGYLVFDEDGKSEAVRGLGKIDVAFQEGRLIPRLHTERVSILHTRYPTAGGSEHLPNIQPLSHEGLTLAHHGNLTNAREILEGLSGGITMGGEFPDNDSWVALNAIVKAEGSTLAEKLVNAQRTFEGGWAFIATDGKTVVASRDPQGIRPLYLGWIGEENMAQSHFLSVENAAFNSIDIDEDHWREVLPGETIEIGNGDAVTVDLSPDPQQRSCLFEMIYMMHPDSKYMGQRVYMGRRNAGHTLWQEEPISLSEDEQLLVMTVPDSGRPAALGYYKEGRKSLGEKIDYEEGLLINRYIGRNFIKPTGRRSPSEKFFVIPELISGKKIVLVDDSLVRGETMTGIIKMLRKAGALEVHIRLASPKIIKPCHWGIAMPTYEELAGYKFPDTEDLTKAVGADSVAYVSLDGTYDAIGADADFRDRFCAHCFGGASPRMNGAKPGTIPLVEFINK